MDMIALPSYEALTQISNQLATEGWSKIPCDFPEEGGIGYMLYRYFTAGTGFLSYGVELQQWCGWYPYGKRETRKEILSRTADVDTLTAALSPILGKQYFNCDDPTKLLMGFVSYEVEHGKANVVQMPITLLKEHAGTMILGKPLREWWDRSTAHALRRVAPNQVEETRTGRGPDGDVQITVLRDA